MTRPAAEPTRLKGKIVEWNSARGYGFVDDGHRRVFAHIRDFSARQRFPAPGDVVHYAIGDDGKGRTCALQIISDPAAGHADDAFIRGRLRPVHLLVLGFCLLLPASAIWRLAWPGDRPWITGWIVLTSAISFGLYAWDKRRAQNGEWRLPEKMLLAWDFLGGWPGGFLAQRHLRHKCIKASFQFAFWLIVATQNFAALDWQLHWRLSRQAHAFVFSKLGIETPPPQPAPRPKVY